MNTYFGGWYFKCQNREQTLAVIPAYHVTDGVPSASIQLITDEGAWNVPFPIEEYRADGIRFPIRIGQNTFGRTGFSLCLHTDGLNAVGQVRFGDLTPLRYDIMGPFRYVPFMECRHSVVSMLHTVTGTVTVNGTSYRFDNAQGYSEGDRGRSFPRTYAWTHCFLPQGSLMLSVAEIPMGKLRFTGIIGAILWEGRQYRIATYLGAKAIRAEKGEIVVRQGDLTLTAKLLERHAHPLFAPVQGAMTRTIRESAACIASYVLEEKGKTVFSLTTDRASFEDEL